jgi:prepilin-type N-terminal cleavage/methylation domain-containing protein
MNVANAATLIICASQYPDHMPGVRTERRSARRPGFSLAELLVTLAVVAIVMSYAVPAWQAQVQSVRRTDATTLLMQVATRQAQFHIQQGYYADTLTLTAAPPAGLGIDPGSSYSLEARITPFGYTAIASVDPRGPQKDDSQCWLFGMDETGRHWAENSAGDDTTPFCWRT